MAIIGHIDLDAFFAAVEERDKPYLAGLPIVVGGDPDLPRGVVSTANYKAREYGIYSALPIKTAVERSLQASKKGEPKAVFLAPRGARYTEVSEEVFAIARSYVKTIEKVSVDEAYLDLSHTRSFKKACLLCDALREHIKRETGLTASIGIAPARYLAKMASESAKPDGLRVVRPRDVDAFLLEKPIRALPGVGPSNERKLARLGIRTVGDVRRVSWEVLYKELGVLGTELYSRALGLGDTTLHKEEASLSIGEEETFFEDKDSLKELSARVRALVDAVYARAEREKVRSWQTVKLKIRFSDFSTHSAQTTLACSVSDKRTLLATALKLLLPYLSREKNPERKKIRLIGVVIGRLVY